MANIVRQEVISLKRPVEEGKRCEIWWKRGESQASGISGYGYGQVSGPQGRAGCQNCVRSPWPGVRGGVPWGQGWRSAGGGPGHRSGGASGRPGQRRLVRLPKPRSPRSSSAGLWVWGWTLPPGSASCGTSSTKMLRPVNNQAPQWRRLQIQTERHARVSGRCFGAAWVIQAVAPRLGGPGRRRTR